MHLRPCGHTLRPLPACTAQLAAAPAPSPRCLPPPHHIPAPATSRHPARRFVTYKWPSWLHKQTEKQRIIFEAFQQADGTITRRYGGTGLGLAICAELANLMGGTVDCSSTLGAGSRFWTTLPLARADAPSQPEESPANPVEAPGLRVLIADDHPVNRKVLEMMLAPSGCELVQVEDGAEAVAACHAENFDVILMDMQMPVMDGVSAVREIRRLEKTRGSARTPIIMVTANALPEHVAASAAAGADSHISKPVRIDALHRAIESALACPVAAVESAAA